MKQFTKKQMEMANKVANDISEGIDGGETRAQLRLCVDVWADRFDGAFQNWKRSAERLDTATLGFRLLATSLENPKSRKQT